MEKLFKVARMLKGFYILIWITVFKLCFCRRRIGLGNESVLGKKYLVYFVKSPYSEANDVEWLCAGAIVSPTQILTAAACLVEVNRIYAIAGYKKYVHPRFIEKDKCANTWKKKVVKISVPKEYAATTAKQLEWMNVDIGVATVQEPYDFNDQSYLVHCSYVPESININNDKANEVVNTRAIALGWGGKKAKSEAEEKLKPKLLKEATTNIIEKTFCTKLVPKNGSKELVEKYLLCASGNGFLGEEGDETTLDPILEKQSPNSSISHLDNITKNIEESNEMSSRKSSLPETCQNDHGGPLIAWVGEEELILGVALNGICNPNFDCVGPRIYVSTVATADIIKCLLETNDAKRKICNDQIDDKRYQVNDIAIEWPENLKNTSTSSVSNQKGSSYRRQNNQEEIFLLRPTKALRSADEPQNLQDYKPEQPQENLQREQRMSRKENSQVGREFNPFYEPQNLPQPVQTAGTLKEEFKNPPRRFVTQQQRERQIQPETNNFHQPQTRYQKQPEVDIVNQPQMGSYNQPSLDPNYNQPRMDSYYNQPQTESKSPSGMESYNQPQKKTLSRSPFKPFNHKPIDQNYQQMDSFNQPSITSQNKPQQPIKNHEVKSDNPQRLTNNDKQQEPELKPLQIEQVDSYKQPQIESFGQLPQGKFFNKPPALLGLMKSLQTNVKTLSHANKEPQSPYSNVRIATFEPEPAESYNPLDIIMAENDDEDLSFKQPIVNPFRPPPVERHKLPKVVSYMPQLIMPSLGKPLEEPRVNQTYQPHSPQHAQPLRQGVGHTSGQFFVTSHQLNALRSPRDPSLHPQKREPQTFEQMISKLHDRPTPALPEETFDEIYRNLHNGRLEEPPDREFPPRNDKPIEQKVEQTDTRKIDESPANVETVHAVQMRKQVPLDYLDYK